MKRERDVMFDSFVNDRSAPLAFHFVAFASRFCGSLLGASALLIFDVVLLLWPWES